MRTLGSGTGAHGAPYGLLGGRSTHKQVATVVEKIHFANNHARMAKVDGVGVNRVPLAC